MDGLPEPSIFSSLESSPGKKRHLLKSIILILLILIPLFLILIFLFVCLREPSLPPQEIKISNVTENSLTVSWISQKSSLQTIYFSKEKVSFPSLFLWKLLPIKSSKIQSASSDFGPIRSTTHHVTLRNLDPETQYYYVIANGFRFYTQDSQNSSHFIVKTASPLENPPSPHPCYGTVIDFADEMPDSPVVVYASTEGSSLVSAFTNSAGNYSLDLSSLRNEDFTAFFDLSQKGTLVLEAEGGLWGRASQPLYRDNCQPIGLLRLE